MLPDADYVVTKLDCMRAERIWPNVLRPTGGRGRQATRARSLRRIELGGGIALIENDRLVGMITDRDIAVRALAQAKRPQTLVCEVMTEHVHYCFDDEDTGEVTRKMADSQVRRLPVVNRPSATSLRGGTAPMMRARLSVTYRGPVVHTPKWAQQSAKQPRRAAMRCTFRANCEQWSKIARLCRRRGSDLR